MHESNQSLTNYEPPRVESELNRARGNSPSDEERSLISVHQIVTILLAYWKISVALFVVLVAVVGLVAVKMPKTYSAVATLIVNFKSQSPLAAQELSDSGSYLSTQIELIRSDSVLDDAISRTSLIKVPEFARGNSGGDAMLGDWVAAKLRQNLEVGPGRYGSQLIYITANASNATLAANIANAVVDAYMERQNTGAFSPSDARAARYTEELAALKLKVETAQRALTAFRNEVGSVDLDSKSDLERNLLQALENRLLEARNVKTSSQARMVGRSELTTSMLTSTTIASLRDEGNKLVAKMAQLRTDYGPNHPDVVALQSQIDANKAALAGAKTAFQNATSFDVEVTSNEVAALEKAVAAQRAKVIQASQYRDQAAKYQLELESAQSVYRKALDGYDQEYFAAKDGQATRVSVVSRARPPVRPSNGKLLKYLMIGVGGGGFLALLVPFALELPRRRIRCRDDLERDMNIPVLMEFPRIPFDLVPASARTV